MKAMDAFIIVILTQAALIRGASFCPVEADALATQNVCGKLLSQLAIQCAPVKPSLSWNCCRILRRWNDANCWCDPNAYESASRLSGDMYAFQFRSAGCGMKVQAHPEMKLPNAGGTIIQNSCGRDVALGNQDIDEGCGDNDFNVEVKQLRLQVLNEVAEFDMTDMTEVNVESEILDEYFAEDMTWTQIGVIFASGRENVKEMLLQRTSALQGGSSNWSGTIIPQSTFWGTARSVSYTVRLKAGQETFFKMDFVLFERCTARISEIITLDDGVSHLFRQFVYLTPSTSPFSQLLYRMHKQTKAEQTCKKIKQLCPASKDLFPFSDESSCVSFYKRLQKSGRVTCLGIDEASCTPQHPESYLSFLTYQGDTLACRLFYLDMIPVEPAKYCERVGRRPVARCRQPQCASCAYADLGTISNPRYDELPALACSSQWCAEDSPIKRQSH